MTQINLKNQKLCDFAQLRHHPIFAVGLSSPRFSGASAFIANGRYVSDNELQVWVLDNSDLLENLRTLPLVSFSIDLLDASKLQGTASVNIGECRVGSFDKRFVELALILDTATREENLAHLSKWLT